jgi:hypothetical protein
MSISNIERMVDALVRDEMNYVQTLNRGELFEFIEELIRDKIELNMNDAEIIESYESLV